MIRHLLSSALIAGFATALLVAVLQYVFVERDILLAEQYETGALVHFQGVATDAHATDHAIDQASGHGTGDATQAAGAHDHAAAASTDSASPLLRHGLTVLFAAVTYVGYALLMVAGFALANQFGKAISLQTGLLWGLAGFAALQLAPAMGLAPELPGTLSAALASRQAWWALAAVATMAGLGLIAYGRGAPLRVAGVALLAAPHLVGAPDPGSFSGVTPPELAAGFAAHSLGTGLIAWVFLGGILARVWRNGSA